MSLSFRFAEPGHGRSTLPSEPLRVVLGRIVDNRLRAVRFWLARGYHADDETIRFVLSDLAAWVERFDSRVEIRWMT